MKPTENMEQFVRNTKPHVTTGVRMDKRVLDDSFAAMDKTLAAKEPCSLRMILRSRTMKLASAAAIIAAVGLLVFYGNPTEQQQEQTAGTAQSPNEMLTAKSLMAAYRHGGIEAIDSQCDKAFEMSGQRWDTLNVKELLAEIEFDLERIEL